MAKIVAVEAGFYTVPLPVVLTDSTHGEMRAFELNTVRLRDADGAEGVGYTFTVGRNGAADRRHPAARDAARSSSARRPTRSSGCGRKAWWALHYGGRGGPTVLAISAFDMALWDLKAKRAGLPLWRLLGGFDPKVPCYAGGIDLDLPLDQLLRQTDGNLAKGFRAIKMKVGRAAPGRGCRARQGDARASRRRLSADGRRQHEMERRRGDPRRPRPPALRSDLARGADHSGRSRRAMPASCARAACRSRRARTCARCGSSSTISRAAA